jgi:uridine phosphorylase
MESAALFIVASYLHVRCGTILLAVANQERAKAGLPNPQVHDTDLAIRAAIEAVKVLIEQDNS